MRSIFSLLSTLLVLLSLSAFVRADDLNTELMKATFKFANEKSTATAFLLSRSRPGDAANAQCILVTAGHVLDNMTGDAATLFLRRSDPAGEYKKVPLKVAIRRNGKPLWTRHPGADVAVMVVVPPAEAEFPALGLDLLATDESLKRYDVHPGDRLAALGYPHRVEANAAGFPILRAGAVASFPLTPTKIYRTFLFAMNVFEGDSGGPVYLDDPARIVGERKQPQAVRQILGLVSGQHFLDEESRMIYGTLKVRHQLGIAIVVPAAFIREAIDQLPMP